MSAILPIGPAARIAGPYTASAGQTSFSFAFALLDAGDVTVETAPAADPENWTPATFGTDWIIPTALPTAVGGNVVFALGRAAGTRVRIVGSAVIANTQDPLPAGRVDSALLNRFFDRLTIWGQEARRDLATLISASASQLTAITLLQTAQAALSSSVASLTSTLSTVINRLNNIDGTAAEEASELAVNAAATSVAAAAQAALYEGFWLDDVAAVPANTSLTYTGGSPSSVTAGDYVRTRAEGFSYEVAAAGATDHHLTTAGGVKLYVLPVDGWYKVEAFSPSGDMTAALNALLSSATMSDPVRVSAKNGTEVQIDGRLHIAPYSTLDFGEFGKGGKIYLGDEGRVTQDGRSHIRAALFALTAGRNPTIPVFAMDTAYLTVTPSLGDFETSYDLSIRGDWQDEALSIVHRSTSSAGYSWIKGRADIREMHYGPRLITTTGGYLNSLRLDYRVYGAVKAYEEFNGGNEIAANAIRLDFQPGRPVGKERTKLAASIEGSRSDYHINVWDWASNTDNSPYAFVLTSKAFYNDVRSNAANAIFAAPPYSDNGVGNRIYNHFGRVNSPAPRSIGRRYRQCRGGETDVLADAYARYPVTVSGTSITSGTGPAMFRENVTYTRFEAVTSASMEIDLTSAGIGEVWGVSVDWVTVARGPDEFHVDLSTDAGATWVTVLSRLATYGPAARLAERFDDIGIAAAANRLRLRMINATARNVDALRMCLHANAASIGTRAGYAPHDSPVFVGTLRVNNLAGNTDYVSNAVVSMNGATVIGATGALRPASDNAVSVGTASLRYTELFAAAGTINTSDERTKALISPVPDEWLDAWGDVQWMRFKMRDAVEAKGDTARWHVGLIAQQVVEAFAARGLDALHLGIVCYDEWDDIWSDDDDPYLIRAAGNAWSLRYDEAQAMEAAWVRRQIARLSASA